MKNSNLYIYGGAGLLLLGLGLFVYDDYISNTTPDEPVTETMEAPKKDWSKFKADVPTIKEDELPEELALYYDAQNEKSKKDSIKKANDAYENSVGYNKQDPVNIIAKGLEKVYSSKADNTSKAGKKKNDLSDLNTNSQEINQESYSPANKISDLGAYQPENSGKRKRPSPGSKSTLSSLKKQAVPSRDPGAIEVGWANEKIKPNRAVDNTEETDPTKWGEFTTLIHGNQQIGGSGAHKLILRVIESSSPCVAAGSLITTVVNGVNGSRILITLSQTYKGRKVKYNAYDEDGEMGLFCENLTAGEQSKKSGITNAAIDAVRVLSAKAGLPSSVENIAENSINAETLNQMVALESGKKLFFRPSEN